MINDENIVSQQNIALCGISCNASKGAKPLSGWLQSKFCRRRGITSEWSLKAAGPQAGRRLASAIKLRRLAVSGLRDSPQWCPSKCSPSLSL